MGAAYADDVEGLRQSRDAAYKERNQVVAGLAGAVFRLGGYAWLGRHPEEDAEWERDWMNIVFIELPGGGGQLSWHIHDSDLPTFKFLRGQEVPEPWDGHSTEEKYRRLTAWVEASR